LSALPAIATTFASDSWPASSTTSTSRRCRIPARANRHAVPATRSTVPSVQPCLHLAVCVRAVDRGSGAALLLGGLLQRPERLPTLLRHARDLVEKVADDLVADGADPDALPVAAVPGCERQGGGGRYKETPRSAFVIR